jgi:hypothetical protein
MKEDEQGQQQEYKVGENKSVVLVGITQIGMKSTESK